ncbi:hypothetical protein POKO110462_15560 [Pontibacter korlensis]|uniref:Uncharacterized protein n=1 Tax=Pontibacter korlensis TaxID=400092 RepID=A0A0E3ZBM1_9BACT|nr:hypothetical protein [Pontibacter korlensis]AKD01854.1 hypothetical protein PKOR_00170 [Pontibacter korlensis]
MKQNNSSYLFLILLLYGGLLMAIAAYSLGPFHKPLDFLLRFSTFWFCSFVLALVVFLYYTKRQIYTLPKVERARVLRLSTVVVSLGTVAALAVVSTLLLVYDI